MIINNNVEIITIRNDSTSIVNIHIIQNTDIQVGPEELYNLSDKFTRQQIANSDVAFHINEGTINLISNSEIIPKLKALKIIYNAPMDEQPKDRSGKVRVHQTSRKLGTRIMWVGLGDDTSDVHNVGGGQVFDIEHNIGEGNSEIVYIDFNIVNNETWLHEGYVTWKDCDMDRLTSEMVTRVTACHTDSTATTNYNLYNDNIIIPAVGDGTLVLDADITDPNAGLVFMPDNDLGEVPTAFWNADYNSTTKLYENITPAPTGNGRYNMFSEEEVLARFLNHMPLLGNGFLGLDSSDTDQMGHGMRIKMIADTNISVGDHKWAVACLMCMHRNSSV
jgi:hypothetical protein